MFKSNAFLVLIFLAGISCSHQQAGNHKESEVSASIQKPLPKQIPLRDFFRNPTKAGFLLSPDGQKIAFLEPYQNRLNVFVAPTKSPEKATRLTSVTDRDIRKFVWKGSSHIIFARDFGGDENDHLFSVSVRSKKIVELTPWQGVKSMMIDDLEDVDINEVMIAHNKRKPELFDVYRVNINSGAIKLVAENNNNYTVWIPDHNGVIRGAVATDGVNSHFYYREDDKKEFRKTFTTDFKTEIQPMFFTFDDKNLYAASNLGRDKMAIVVFDLSKGKELETVFNHKDVDVTGLDFSKRRKVLTTATYVTWKKEDHFFDKRTESVYQEVATKLPNQELNLVSTDRREDSYIFKVTSDKSRGSYYLYNKNDQSLNKLADLSPWLNEADLAPMKPISYQSRDGLTINGYLTLPLNYDGKPIPFIINPHGGPWARDQWGFDPEVQFLANRGYGVLQMNFRGSTGYGRKFWEASFKQWGKKMQDDVTDGVRWLISQNYAMPQRVCIYGGSYGGYSVLAGLAFTPEVYACGVDYVGVSNLFSFMKSIPPYWKPYLEMLYEMVGNPEKEKDLMQAASPVFHVDKIKAPLFVAQGAKDPRVNINESNQIVNGLKSRGIDVPYLVKDNEGHGFHNEENRFEFYGKMEEFLSKHLKR